VITPTGGIAWIACPEAGELGSLRPTCVRPGHADRVYKADSTGRRRLLDRGRDIDPSSLRRSGSRIRWVAGGRTHRGRLR